MMVCYRKSTDNCTTISVKERRYRPTCCRKVAGLVEVPVNKGSLSDSAVKLWLPMYPEEYVL